MKVLFYENDDPIDIRYDNVFKAVFTKEIPASQQALSELISALIGRTVSIVTLCINEPPVTNLKDRKIRFDISCKTENDERVNVEMSLDPKSYEPFRLEYYSGILFTGQEISGTDKDYNDLKRTYQIAILAKERFFEYLTDRNKTGRIREIIEKEGGIAMANEVLKSISKDEIERVRLMSELKNRLDYQSERAYELKKGLKKEREKIACNAFAEGIPINKIHNITGLDLETLKNIEKQQN